MTFLALLSVVLLAVGAWYVTALLRLRRSSEFWPAFLVVFLAQWTFLGVLVGGVLRQLNATALMTSAVLVCAGEVYLGHRYRAAEGVRPPVVNLLRGLRPVARRPWVYLPVIALAGFVAVQYAWRLAMGLLLPANDWDGLWYHRSGADLWIQAGRIIHTPGVFWSDVYPNGQELLYAWVGTFVHGTRFAWATQYPFLALGATSVAAIAAAMGARRRYAVLAGLSFLALPAVFNQASTAYVDIAAAATPLAALLFATVSERAARESEARLRTFLVYAGLAGLAAGVGAGIKTSNLLPLGFAGLIVVVQAVRLFSAPVPSGSGLAGIRAAATGARESVRPALLGGILMVVPFVGIAGYWYVRTWVRYGNPFYPFSMLGFHGQGSVKDLIMKSNTPATLTQQSDSTAEWVLRSWGSDLHRHPGDYDLRLGAYGMQWIYILVPAVIVVGAYLFTRRSAFLWGLLLPVVIMLVSSPGPWWPRYTLPFAGIACACAGLALSKLHFKPLAWVASGVLVSLTAVSMWWATEPTYYRIDVSKNSFEQATVSQLFKAMRDPSVRANVEPNASYRQYDTLPDGSTVGVTENTDVPSLHMIIGRRLQRHLVSLGDVESANGLAASMRRHGAQYVALFLDGTKQKEKDLVAAARARPDLFTVEFTAKEPDSVLVLKLNSPV